MHRWRRPPLVRLVAVTAVAVTATTAAAGAAGPFSASVANGSDTAGSATLLFGHAYGSSSCSSVPASGGISNATVASVACPATVLPATDTGSAATASDSVTNQGSTPAAAVTARVGVTSCAPRALGNVVAPADPMLPRYATTFNAMTGTAGTASTNLHPLAGGGSVTFNGTTDYASDVTQTTFSSFALGSTTSYGIWFKTTTTSGGGLLSFDSSPTTAAGGTGYLAVAMTAAGTLTVVDPVGVTVTPTARAYNDGLWHYAYLTVMTSTALGVTTGTVALYLDGTTTAVIGPTSGLVVAAAPVGYWHAGWSRAAGYLAGSESSPAVLGAALSSGATLYNAGTQSAYDAIVKSNSGVNEWPLDDASTVTYTGTLPVIGSTSPCTMTNLAWAGSAAQSFATTVSTPIAVAVPAPGATAPNAVVLSTNAAYNTAYVPGLQMYAPLTYTVTAGGGAWSTVFAWSATSGYVA